MHIQTLEISSYLICSPILLFSSAFSLFRNFCFISIYIHPIFSDFIIPLFSHSLEVPSRVTNNCFVICIRQSHSIIISSNFLNALVHKYYEQVWRETSISNPCSYFKLFCIVTSKSKFAFTFTVYVCSLLLFLILLFNILHNSMQSIIICVAFFQMLYPCLNIIYFVLSNS